MRTLNFRVAVLAAVLVGLGAALLSTTRSVLGQQRAQIQIRVAQPAPPIGPGGEEPPKNLIEKFSFPEDRDTNLKFEAVLDYLNIKNEKKIEWPVVVKLAQGLLDAKSDFFYQYQDKDKRRVSVKDEISRLIGTFTKDGREFYQLTYGPVAEGDLKGAAQNGYDVARLAIVSQKYFHTKAGAAATLLLARINLEFGNFPEAAHGFQRLLARADAEDVLDSKALFQVTVALRRAGETRRPELLTNLWDKIEKKFPRDGVVFGSKTYSLENLKAEYDRNIEFLYGKVSTVHIAMKGGDATRAGVADAGAPFLDPLFSMPALYRIEDANQKTGADFVRQNIENAYKQASRDKKKMLLPSFFPVTAPNMIIFRGYDGTYSFYTKDGVGPTGKPFRTGELAWFSPSKGGAQTLWSAEDTVNSTEKQNVQSWWQQYWQNQMPSVLFENPLLGSLSHDGKYVYYIDDLAVLPFQQVNYNDGWGGMPQPGTNDGPKGMKDYSRLVAVDIETGSLSWTLGGIGAQLKAEEEDKITSAAKLTENSFFMGAPLPINGKLYVLFEREGHLKMACLDPHKTTVPPAAPAGPNTANVRASMPVPELLWVQNLGRANNPLRQDSLRRIQSSFMAAADGVIICPTNSGAVIAVDVNARSLLWAHTYNAGDTRGEIGPGGNPGGFRRQPFPGGGMGGQALPNERWRSANPIIVNGRIVMNAYDSDQVQCLELRTGKLLWTENRQVEDMYVGGVVGGNVIIVGRNSVRAIKLVGEKDEKTGREKAVAAWKEPLKIGYPSGHGVPSKDGLYYLPVIGDPDKPDSLVPAVWAINADTGIPKAKTPFRRKEGNAGPAQDSRLSLGNLVFHDGMMFSQSATEISAFPLIEVKKREMDALLGKNPNDPEGLTSRGELLLDDGKLNEAIADFKKAQLNKPAEATLRKISQKLYVAYTEILRGDFAAANKFLPEYKQLCEFAITAEEGSPERAREIEEQTRRKGLFYSLVAKGCEKEGRLVEAFDNYRAYAALGEKGRLLPVPEDTNTLALSSVWASGRIDAMMRAAKDDVIRKPLEDRVAKEWDTVRGANDLVQLESFVKTFGPYFASGREAQFLLAERLMLTNNDDDKRKAQSYLLNLVGDAEDTKEGKLSAARATEGLARLLTGRNMMEDAVGMYSRLGLEFPTTVVRDGKTGADIYGDIITDKRLLPSLEPARIVSLSKYKVENSPGNNGGYRANSQAINPDGDLLPFFKRYRISLDLDQQTQLQTLKVTDRVTAEERVKFTGLQQMPMYNNNGQPQSTGNARFAQASGHLLMLHVGQFVHCYDLSQEKGKELWKQNLLIQDVLPAGTLQMDPTPNPEGDVVFRTLDGWAFRLGKSSVLQSSYAAVLTRDGLFVLDPRTGTKLWSRGNVSGRASVYGDARYIYLVEASSTGTTSRVLRASDGAAVEGIKDFGSLIGGPNRLAMFGRQLLLSEPGTKDAPRIIRLYDIVEGKDVWSKKFPSDSVILKTQDPEITGVVSVDGAIQVLSAKTGKVLLDGKIDADKVEEHLKVAGKIALKEPLLMADSERFYVFLNKDDKGQLNPNMYWNGQAQVKTTGVNGACYAFDRTTSKRLWYTDGQFLRQLLCLERFEEMPCIVASHPFYMEPDAKPGNNVQQHQVLAVDKRTGVLKLYKNNLSQGQGQFQTLIFDAKTGSFEFWNYNLRVKITAE